MRLKRRVMEEASVRFGLLLSSVSESTITGASVEARARLRFDKWRRKLFNKLALRKLCRKVGLESSLEIGPQTHLAAR